MNNNLGNKEIMAKNILRFMEMYGKDRKEICRDLNIRYTTFTDWVKARTYPRIDKIEMLAKYFGVQKADLVEEYKPDDQGYYLDPETAKTAQEIFDNPDLRALFDAGRDSKPEDLRMAADLLTRLKETNRDG